MKPSVQHPCSLGLENIHYDILMLWCYELYTVCVEVGLVCKSQIHWWEEEKYTSADNKENLTLKEGHVYPLGDLRELMIVTQKCFKGVMDLWNNSIYTPTGCLCEV